MNRFRRVGLVVAVATALVSATFAQEKSQLIRASKIYIGDGTVIENGAVLIQGGKIRAVGESVAAPDGTELVELPDGVVLTPGLIDCSSEANGRAVTAEQISEIVPETRVVDGLDLMSEDMKRLAIEGVTCVFCPGDSASVFSSQGTVVKTGMGADGRVLIEGADVRTPLNSDPEGRGVRNGRPFGRQPGSFNSRYPTTKMGTVFVFRDAMAKLFGSKAGELGESQAILRDIAAGKRRLRFLASQESELSTALRLVREFGLKNFAIEQGWEVYRVIDALKATGAPVIYGPVVDASRRPPYLQEVSYNGVVYRTIARMSTPRLLADKKIPFVITAGDRRGETGLVRQVMFAIRGGLSRSDALQAVTSRAAKILGVEKRVGKIATGLDADLVVWNGEPFGPASRPVRVFVNGSVVEGKTF